MLGLLGKVHSFFHMLYLDPADLSVSGPPKMALNTHYVPLLAQLRENFDQKYAHFLTGICRP